MNIELSDRKYWKKLNYHDGLLYCSLLEIDDKNDWRMIKDMGEWDYIHGNIVSETGPMILWCQTDVQLNRLYYEYYVIPVRDI